MMLIERLEERGNQLKKMTFWKVRSLEDLEGHLMLVEIHHNINNNQVRLISKDLEQLFVLN